MPATSVLSAGIVVADIFVPPLERLPQEGELLATGGWRCSGHVWRGSMVSSLAQHRSVFT